MFEKEIKRQYAKNFDHRCDDPGYNKYYTYLDFPGMKEEKFSFSNEDGDTLRGGLYYNDASIEDHDTVIVFFHGMTCGYLAYMNEINMLVKAGFLVLSYDCAATFSSDGKVIGGFSRPLSDFRAAHKAIKADDRLKNMRLIVMGHSWGAFTAMCSLQLFDDIDRAVCISPPLSYKSMIRAMFKGPLGVMISHFTLKYEAKLFGDLAYMTGLDSVNDKRKILHVYSTDDPTVLYKYNYLPLEKADNNPAHKRVVFKDKEHFPLMTRSAVIKFRKKQAEVNRLLGEGKSVQEIKEILNEDFNWDEIVEQDKTVWKIVTDFLNEA